MSGPGTGVPRQRPVVVTHAEAEAPPPKREPGPSTQYLGGQILDKPEVETVYLGDYFATGDGAKVAQRNDQFVRRYVEDPGIQSVWHQYGIEGAVLAPSRVLPGQYTEVTDRQLKQLAAQVAAADAGASAQRVYNFVLPPNASLKWGQVLGFKGDTGDSLRGIADQNGRDVFFTASIAGKNETFQQSRQLTNTVTNPQLEHFQQSGDLKTLGWMDAADGDVTPPSPREKTYSVGEFPVAPMWSQKDQTAEVRAKQPAGVEPLPAPTLPIHVKYSGGGVLKNPIVRNHYLGEYFETPEGKADIEDNERFTKNYLADPGVVSVMHQYGVDSGTAEAPVQMDGDFARVNKDQLYDFVKGIISRDPSPDPNRLYNFVLPPGAVLTDSWDSGYHGTVLMPDGRKVPYSVIVPATDEGGFDLTGNPRDNLTAVEAHEFSEAATDPVPDNGWIDPNSDYQEVADIARITPPTRLNGFAVRRVWSQKDEALELSAKTPGPLEPPPGPQYGVQYFGGPVLNHPAVKTLYIGDYFATDQGRAEQRDNDGFVSRLVQEPGYSNIWKQYGVQRATSEESATIGGTFKELDARDVEKLVKEFAAKDAGLGSQRLYNVVLAPGIKLEDERDQEPEAGFHGSVHLPGGFEVFYAASRNWRQSPDDMSNEAKYTSIHQSRNLTNAMTNPGAQDRDPAGHAARGWVDPVNGEVGDLVWGRDYTDRLANGDQVRKIWSQRDQQTEIAAADGP